MPTFKMSSNKHRVLGLLWSHLSTGNPRFKTHFAMVLYKALIIASTVLFVGSIGLGWIAFPMVFKKFIRKKINLAPNSETRGLWQAFPFPFDFAVHVFNVTNPLEVQSGAKPILQDVGPFVFDEFKDKYDLEDNEADDTVSFNMRNTFIFRADKSGGLTGEEVITMPHPLIQIMAISVKSQGPETLKVVSAGLKMVFPDSSPFISAPFMDLFFRGILVDCSSEHYAAQAVCGQFHAGLVKGARKFNTTHFTFSLMGEGNHTSAGRFTVSRGKRVPQDIGRVLAVNGKKSMDVWPGTECNKFRGTDGTIFAPFMDPRDGLWSYSADLCRSMAPTMMQSVQYADLPAVRFVMDFGDIQNEEQNHCYCRSYPEVCPLKGTMDLSPCTQTPMIASMPHFLNADERLLDNIEGLKPSSGQHGTHIDFEVFSGTPLSVYKRIQFNLNVESVAEVDGMENMRSVVMPMFWIDESLNLVPAVTDELKKIFKMLLIKDIIRWSALVISIIGFATVCYLHGARKGLRLVEPVN